MDAIFGFIVMTFIACMQDQCRRIELPGEGGVQACMLAAQGEAAKWTREHPGTVIRGRITCGPARSDT